MVVPINWRDKLHDLLMMAFAQNLMKRQQQEDEAFEKVETHLLKVRENEAKLEASIGRFVRRWSSCEYAMYRVLVNYAGVSKEVAHAIFSGARTKQMQNFVKAIAHNTKMQKERVQDFERLSAQVTTINDTRDMLLHNFHPHIHTFQEVDLSDASPVVSNFARVTRVGNEKAYELTDEDVVSMCDDLKRIENALLKHLPQGEGAPFAPLFPLDEPIPWLYKPRQR